MRTRRTNIGLVSRASALLIIAGVHPALAQNTAFTYQGRLNDNGNPANGTYDLQFAVFDSGTGAGLVAGPLTNAATAVSNGQFLVTLDFGAGVFIGPARWLEIAVRTNGNGAFGILSPRQAITPTPQALYAANAGSAATATVAVSANSVSAANLIGTVADSQLSSNIVRLTIPNTATQATAALIITAGFITGTTNLNGGAGYTTAPLVTITDASGSNAVIIASVGNGAVTNLTIQDAGKNYSAGATLTIAPPPSNAYQTFTSGNVFNGVNTFTGANNTFVGSFSGNGAGLTNLDLTGPSTLAGLGNTANGYQALGSNTTGYKNTANGYQALYSNTSGYWNTANGNQALFSNTTGNGNVAVGVNALLSNTNGIQNTASGNWALNSNTSGSQNTANGMSALNWNRTGSQNTANGQSALYNNTTGSNNIALGYWAGYNLTTGSSNIDIGNRGVAGDDNTIRIGSGQTHAFIAGVITGDGSGLLNLSASQLVSGTIPLAQLPPTVVTNSQTGVTLSGAFSGDGVELTNLDLTGPSALSGLGNTANGYQALHANTTGYYDTANGYQALYNNTSGYWNTANGYEALFSNTTGSFNTANGRRALASNTTGYDNTANGVEALLSNTTGHGNTANGRGALLSNTTGSYNTANGQGALNQNTTGSYNTASGWRALYLNTTASQNTAVGYQALNANTTGSNNIAVGFQAGLNLTNGNNNIDIGNPGVAGDTNIIRIGIGQTQAFIAGAITGNGAGLTSLSADAITGGLTTNLAVLVPGGGTNTLYFTNGVLRAVQ